MIMENNVKGNDTKKTCRVKYYSVEVTVKSCIMMWEQRKLEGKKQEGSAVSMYLFVHLLHFILGTYFI